LFKRWFCRYYALKYDSVARSAERAGLAARRHALLKSADGATIEIGAATGLNIRHIPRLVSQLVLVEPDRHMSRQLIRRALRIWPGAGVVRAVAEGLPFADASFDTAIVVFLLCSVRDQQAVLRELARILVPGGKLLFMEHVRSSDPEVVSIQDKIPFPYRVIGCHPNRDTLAEIVSSPFIVETVSRDEVPRAPAIERPMIAGLARTRAPSR
jgi:ubiquinone/menaquinone biosynthesis C-methylase UbiE